MKSTARREHRPKTEEECKRKAEERRETGKGKKKKKNSKETFRLEYGTPANYFGSNSDEQTNGLFANPRQVCSAEAGSRP